MSILLFLAAAATETPALNPIQQISKDFGWNGWALLCQMISFSIVCFALYKFAYHPILAVLEERRQLIASGIENAKNADVKIAEARKAADEILAKTNAEASKMIEEARVAAKLVSERESQRAVVQAAEIIQKAREAGEAEQKRLMAELRKDLSRLIVESTAKVTGKILTDSDQKNIAAEAAKELAA